MRTLFPPYHRYPIRKAALGLAGLLLVPSFPTESPAQNQFETSSPCCYNGDSTPTSCLSPQCIECVQSATPEPCLPEFWTSSCQIAAEDFCAVECGCSTEETKPLLSCCEVNSNTPGCVDPLCMDCVCAKDPYCCDTAWDPGCAAVAALSCKATCGCGAVSGAPNQCPFPNSCVGAKVIGPNGTCIPVPTGAPVGPTSCPLALYDFVTCGPGPNVVFVLQSAPPGGIGTQLSPFQTIADGLAAVPPGGTVCVGRGIYPEFLVVQKPVRVIGTCPKLTRVTSGGFLIQGTQQVELQGMTVSHTDFAGIQVFQAQFVTLRKMLVEHNPMANVWVEQSLTGNLPGPMPSKCGCGPQHNVDICLSTFQFSKGAGAGLRGLVVDDVRIQTSAINRNGTGLRFDQDALLVWGSTLSGNIAGLVSRNPQENIEVANSRIQRNIKLGLGISQTLAPAPKILVALTNNEYSLNYGTALTAINDTPLSETLSIAVQNSLFTANRSAGIFTSRTPVTIQSSTVSGTITGPAGPGRGIEVLLTDSVRVQSTTVKTSAEVGILVGLLDSVTPLLQGLIDNNTITDNGYYGISLQPFFTGPEPPCPVPSSVPGGVSMAVTNNTVATNVGTGVAIATFDYRVVFSGNVISDTLVGSVGSQAVPANYGVAATCSSFNLSSSTVGFQTTPTATFLAELVKTKSTIPSLVADSTTLTPPTVDINDPVLTNLVVSPKFAVNTGVNLPMPCPLLPTDPTTVKDLLNSL
ncbi:MAG: right-handed parallel beta-helix repeat-containing protein [Myxococcales bacterium]|nr:right-handed parallel beta-helix repeat-containing protein [Myxococcales bacterium]